MLGGSARRPRAQCGCSPETGECSGLTQERFSRAQRSYLYPPR